MRAKAGVPIAGERRNVARARHAPEAGELSVGAADSIVIEQVDLAHNRVKAQNEMTGETGWLPLATVGGLANQGSGGVGGSATQPITGGYRATISDLSAGAKPEPITGGYRATINDLAAPAPGGHYATGVSNMTLAAQQAASSSGGSVPIARPESTPGYQTTGSMFGHLAQRRQGGSAGSVSRSRASGDDSTALPGYGLRSRGNSNASAGGSRSANNSNSALPPGGYGTVSRDMAANLDRMAAGFHQPGAAGHDAEHLLHMAAESAGGDAPREGISRGYSSSAPSPGAPLQEAGGAYTRPGDLQRAFSGSGNSYGNLQLSPAAQAARAAAANNTYGQLQVKGADEADNNWQAQQQQQQQQNAAQYF